MDDVLTLSFLTSVLAAAIPAGTAILFACLGELLCERAGVLNLGVEGMMLVGALGGFDAAYWTESAWLGRLHPAGVTLVAFLLAAMLVGGDQLQATVGLPAAIAPMLQGTILFFLLGGEALTRYRLTWRGPAIDAPSAAAVGDRG